MSLLDDIKSKLDASGDGTINASDLSALKDTYTEQGGLLDTLKAKADASGDGKLSLDDLTSLGGNLGGALSGLKDRFLK